MRRLDYAVLLLSLAFFHLIPIFLYADVYVSIGVYQNEPLVFVNSNESVAGVYPDIIKHIASEEKWRVEYVFGSRLQCLERLASGEIDLMAAIAYSQERSKQYDFTHEALLWNWGQIYTKRDTEIQSLFDLKHKAIAALKDDVYYHKFQRLVENSGIDCSFIEVDDYNSVFEFVDSGKADVGITTRLCGIQHEGGYRIDESSIIFSPVELRFAVSKGKNYHLINAIDRHVTILKRDRRSIYYQSLNRWLKLEAMNRWMLPKWTEWTLASLGGLLLLFLVMSVVLRVRVKARTDELSSKSIELQEEIAERKRTEEALMEAQTLSSLSRTTASIAHEMRSPLTAADMDLEDALEELSDGDARDLVSKAQSLIQEVLLIIRTMMKMYRSENQGANEVDLNQELKDAILLFGRKAKGIEIIYDFADEARVWVHGNLSRVFINLIGNALDALRNQGHLTLSTRRVEDGLLTEVEDDGPGILPEIIEEIFDPGFTTKKIGEGTGLGLWIANREIERLGGRITVESEVGKLTRFSVIIPNRYNENES